MWDEMQEGGKSGESYDFLYVEFYALDSVSGIAGQLVNGKQLLKNDETATFVSF